MTSDAAARASAGANGCSDRIAVTRTAHGREADVAAINAGMVHAARARPKPSAALTEIQTSLSPSAATIADTAAESE
jgi:hypothetical protein